MCRSGLSKVPPGLIVPCVSTCGLPLAALFSEDLAKSWPALAQFEYVVVEAMSRGGVVCALEFLRYGAPIYRSIVLHLCREIGNTLCGMCTPQLSVKSLLHT